MIFTAGPDEVKQKRPGGNRQTAVFSENTRSGLAGHRKPAGQKYPELAKKFFLYNQFTRGDNAVLTGIFPI